MQEIDGGGRDASLAVAAWQLTAEFAQHAGTKLSLEDLGYRSSVV